MCYHFCRLRVFFLLFINYIICCAFHSGYSSYIAIAATKYVISFVCYITNNMFYFSMFNFTTYIIKSCHIPPAV
ncbi:MAG: hypothetical protein ACKPKO_39930, partial [Candidatus Fonsibacter sp.]